MKPQTLLSAVLATSLAMQHAAIKAPTIDLYDAIGSAYTL